MKATHIGIGCLVVCSALGGTTTGCTSETQTDDTQAEGALLDQCDPLEIGCTAKGKTEYKRLSTAANASSIADAYGSLNGNSVSWDYLPNGLGWYKLTMTVNGSQLIAQRYAYDWSGGGWLLYYEKAVDTKVANNAWSWADYSIAANLIGRANDTSFRNQTDGAVVKLLTSTIGLNGVQALAASTHHDNVGRACHSYCMNAADAIGFYWFAVPAGILCTVVTANPVAGLGCGYLGDKLAQHLISSEGCYDECLSCYDQMASACWAGTPTNARCDSKPFSCSGRTPGSTVVVQQIRPL